MASKNKTNRVVIAETDTEIKAPEASVEITPKTYCKVAGCPLLNLRKAPNKNAEIIDVLKAGTELLVLEEGNEFSKVRNEKDKTEGYAMSQYLLVFSENY